VVPKTPLSVTTPWSALGRREAGMAQITSLVGTVGGGVVDKLHPSCDPSDASREEQTALLTPSPPTVTRAL
jgi:hypothetical protein